MVYSRNGKHVPSATALIVGRGLGDRRHDERLHTCARLLVRVLYLESRVDDLDDVVDGDRRLGDVVVAGKTLRAPGGVGDLGLYAARQVGVDEDLNAEAARAVLQRLEGRLDLVLPHGEVEHVAGCGST